jgi:tyrosyl-tRNA synthetase
VSRDLFERLRERAVQIHVEEHLRARLDRGDRLRVKLGIDPTSPDLHVGHLILFDVLRLFHDHGHQVVLIVGDYTAMIGDPSGRSESRPMLTREQVDANARTYFDQAFLVLDRQSTEIHGNAEWLATMTAADILRLLSKVTVQQVLQREDFAERMRAGAPIGAHEILYPFSQAYDSVAVQADVEIGGTDQLFNLLFGREIQKAYGQEPQDTAVFPLLEGTDGVQKMSKSLGNYIGIADPPDQVYGKTMSIPDSMIPKYLRLVSGLARERQEEVLAMKPRDAKAALARALVARLAGGGAAAAAEEDFDKKFREGDASSVSGRHFEDGLTVADVALQMGWARSFSEVRRLAGQGGLRVNDRKVAADHTVQDGDVVRYGKKSFVRVEVEG